ncbi:nucleotide-binding protein [Paenibacillus pinihumi]|uniref:nucleotide-binding protein n=1 Tax=Paenibacillus pinihumi TaxID=669462 RepID=UPI001B7FCC39|nr:nucleotide-binding protein [Paenibacillus pinihumi]
MQNIFLGSSNLPRALDDLRYIAMLVQEENFNPLPWNKADVLPLGSYILDSLRELCKKVDRAIFIFNEDDQVEHQNNYIFKPRGNVIFEYALFVEALGRDKVIICRRGNPAIPSDLNGIMYCDLDKGYRAEIELLSWLRRTH